MPVGGEPKPRSRSVSSAAAAWARVLRCAGSSRRSNSGRATARPGQIAKSSSPRTPAAASDPASAVAAAVYGALERDYGGLRGAGREATHATVDPRHAAAAAAERHDEVVGRLEQERRARDEVEARRSRLSESLLGDAPGPRIDAYIRASRGSIDSKLRRFGFEGDGAANFRSLVGDLAGVSAQSRLGLFLRAILGFRGQTRLLVLAILAFALAFGADRLRQPAVEDWLTGLSASLAPAVDALKAHDGGLGFTSEALVVAGLAALAVNLWRAAGFTRLMFQGLRMLKLDLHERRRELDVSAARLERRVAALQMEAEAAGERAEAMARRAVASQGPSRAPGPTFLSAADGPERAARAFLDGVGRVMDSGVTAAPQRVLIAIDGLDALPPEAARRFLETAARVAGRGFAVIAAVDLAPLGDPREIAETQFDVVFDIAAPAAAAAAPWLPPPAAPAAALAEAKPCELAGPLDETEAGWLRSASPLIGPRPRALKRFYNAYRLARLSDAPRGALALSLAALMAADPDAATALRFALAGEGELAAPAAPAALAAAYGRLGVQGVGKAAARRAFETARRFAPWG